MHIFQFFFVSSQIFNDAMLCSMYLLLLCLFVLIHVNINTNEGTCNTGTIKLKQELKAGVEQMCAQGADFAQKNDQTAAITNKVSQKATQKASTPNPFIIFIIFAIVIGLIMLSPIALVFVIGAKIVPIMGIVLIIIGMCMLPAYFFTQYKGGNYKNSPLLLTSRQQANPTGVTASNWGDVKSTYDKDNKIVAFDFIPTCITLEGQSACATEISDGYKTYPMPKANGAGEFVYPPHTPGTVVYYSNITSDVKKGVSMPPRGTAFGDLGKNGNPDDPAYNATISGWSEKGDAEQPDGCALFNGDGIVNGPICSAQVPAKKSALLKVTSSSDPVFPTVTYVRDYKQSYWLFAGIGTGVIGLLILGIGVWMMSGSKKKGKFNLISNKNNSSNKQSSKPLMSKKK